MRPCTSCVYTTVRIDHLIKSPLRLGRYNCIRSLHCWRKMCWKMLSKRRTKSLCSFPRIDISKEPQIFRCIAYQIGSIFAAWALKKSFEKLVGKGFRNSRDLRTVFRATAPRMAFEHPCLTNKDQNRKERNRLRHTPVDRIHSHDAITNSNEVIWKIASLMVLNVW